MSLNTESLKYIVEKRPKIIHICCSGTFDKDGEFYMKLEAGNGMEDKFYQKRLGEILNPDGKGCGI